MELKCTQFDIQASTLLTQLTATIVNYSQGAKETIEANDKLIDKLTKDNESLLKLKEKLEKEINVLVNTKDVPPPQK